MDSEAIAALVGVVIGAVLSTASGLFIVRAERRSQERYEVWIRLLNSYQDFANSVRAITEFRSKDKTLYNEALAAAHKCLNDARTLDPVGEARTRRMKEIMKEASSEDSPTPDAGGRIGAEADAIFKDFYDDARLRFSRLKVRGTK